MDENERLVREKLADEHIELAARERTFDAAYTRTALNLMATGLLIYKVFYYEFAAISIAITVTGVLIWASPLYNRLVITPRLYRMFMLEDRAEDIVREFIVPVGGSVENLDQLVKEKQEFERRVTVQASPTKRSRQLTNDTMSHEERRSGRSRQRSVSPIPQTVKRLLTFPSDRRSRTTSPNRSDQRKESIELEPLSSPQQEEQGIEGHTTIDKHRLVAYKTTRGKSMTREEVMQSMDKNRPDKKRVGKRSVIIPSLPSTEMILSRDYFEWRAQQPQPPKLAYFRTSGNLVLFMGLMIAAMQIVVFSLLLRM